MKTTSTILIADRNPYVRKLLQRELNNAGYQVLLAENARQIAHWIDRNASIDLAILDPDMPDTNLPALFEDLQSRCPHLPVLVHGHPSDDTGCYSGTDIWFIEKRGSSIEKIIQMAGKILNPDKIEAPRC